MGEKVALMEAVDDLHPTPERDADPRFLNAS